MPTNASMCVGSIHAVCELVNGMVPGDMLHVAFDRSAHLVTELDKRGEILNVPQRTVTHLQSNVTSYTGLQVLCYGAVERACDLQVLAVVGRCRPCAADSHRVWEQSNLASILHCSTKNQAQHDHKRSPDEDHPEHVTDANLQ